MNANIVVKDKEGVGKFLAGGTVFKITVHTFPSPEEKSIYGMVTTKEDYEKKLSSHEYIAILHISPLTYRLAYLYGCLNHVKSTPRTEIFTFWSRSIGKREWTEWFIVYPYTD